MLKWYYNWKLRSISNPHYLTAIDKVEDVFSNKGAMRLLILMRYYNKPLRHTQLRETCKLPVNTLNHTLGRLIEKGLVERTYIDVETPRKQKKVTHYALTVNGKMFHRCALEMHLCSLRQARYETKRINKMLEERL